MDQKQNKGNAHPRKQKYRFNKWFASKKRQGLDPDSLDREVKHRGERVRDYLARGGQITLCPPGFACSF